MIENILRKIRLLVGKALVDVVNLPIGDEGLSVDISLAGGEKHTKVPLRQQYGFASRPKRESEAVVLFIGGARDNGVAIATQGDPSRIPSLKDGEVAIFSEFGQTLVLKEDGSVEITPKSGKNVVIKSGMDIDGDVNVGGKMDVTSSISSNDTITALTDVKAGVISLTGHIHGITGVTPGQGAGICSTPTPAP